MSKTLSKTAEAKAARRVLIAKDVIKQLATKRYVAKAGDYLYATPKVRHANLITFNDVGTDLRDILKTRVKRCEVCARGAVFAAAVERYDNCTITRDDARYGTGGSRSLAGQMNDTLAGHFGQTQLDLIERYFEGYGDGFAFHKKHRSASARMVAIMRNIIKNKGTFVPELA